ASRAGILSFLWQRKQYSLYIDAGICPTTRIMKFEIPSEDKQLLKAWLVGEGKPFESVMSTLEQMDPCRRIGGITERLVKQAELQEEEASEVAILFVSVARTADRFDESDEEFRAQLFRSVVGDVVDAS